MDLPLASRGIVLSGMGMLFFNKDLFKWFKLVTLNSLWSSLKPSLTNTKQPSNCVLIGPVIFEILYYFLRREYNYFITYYVRLFIWLWLIISMFLYFSVLPNKVIVISVWKVCFIFHRCMIGSLYFLNSPINWCSFPMMIHKIAPFCI